MVRGFEMTIHEYLVMFSKQFRVKFDKVGPIRLITEKGKDGISRTDKSFIHGYIYLDKPSSRLEFRFVKNHNDRRITCVISYQKFIYKTKTQKPGDKYPPSKNPYKYLETTKGYYISTYVYDSNGFTYGWLLEDHDFTRSYLYRLISNRDNIMADSFIVDKEEAWYGL